MRNGGTDGIERSVTWKQHAHMHKQKQKRSASEECCHKAHLHFPGKAPVASYSQVIKSLWLFNLVLSRNENGDLWKATRPGSGEHWPKI